MDRQIVGMLRTLLTQVLEQGMEDDVKERFKFSLGNCRFSGTDATFKLTILDKESSNGAESIEEARFKQNAHFYGLKASDIHKKFFAHGDHFKLLGFTSRMGKYPVCCERIHDKKRFRLPLASVQKGLQEAGTTSNKLREAEMALRNR